MFLRDLVCALFGLSFTACHGPEMYDVQMPSATPDIIARARSSATFTVQASAVPEPVETTVENLWPSVSYRVYRVSEELAAGVGTVLGSFLTPARAAPDYIARIEVLSLTTPQIGRDSAVAVRWRFTLDDAQGQHIIQLERKSWCAIPFGDGESLKPPLRVVQNGMLDIIRSALADSKIANLAK